jgi:hypothetical protein
MGARRPKLQVCDFREQTGIYILHDDYGPYYVGLTRKTPIGNRLRAHLSDRHEGLWDRFSWFGFNRILKTRHADGTQTLGRAPTRLNTATHSTIGDVEALLIQALGTQHRSNAVQMRFASADPWTQIMAHETEKYVANA